MAKKKQGKAPSAAPAAPVETISRKGWQVIACGAGCVVLGFAVLTRADPFGRNFASSLCPFLILGGYALMGLGIFLPESSQKSSEVPAAPSPVFSQKNR